MFAALLDTSVLWPSLQRDFLLSLAAEGLYRPLWSSAILAELEFHEARKLVGRGEDADAAAGRARHLLDQMSSAFDDALVENWELLDGTFGLPDPDDEHVVAAAFIGGAEVIVTSNINDFPTQRIPEPLRVSSPAEFAADTVAVSPDLARRAVTVMSARFFVPPLNIDQILGRLTGRYGMAEAVELIRAAN
jgi:PIN domain